MRLVITGEISSAKNFGEHCAVYVHHEMRLPTCWRVDPVQTNSLLSSNTQISVGLITNNEDDGSYTRDFRFSHPFEFSLLTNGKYPLTQVASPEMPKMFFKVVAVDMMDRHSVEGYGYLKFPNSAGTYMEQIHTWKAEVNAESRIRTYFVGGCPELEDLEYPILSHVILFNKAR
jgi:Ciliary basal body-associated, B9 protein